MSPQQILLTSSGMTIVRVSSQCLSIMSPQCLSIRRVDRRNFPTSLSQNCTETSRFIQLPLFSPLILTQVSNDRKYLETSFSLFLEIALLVFHDLEVSYIWF